ncbi:YgaP family membrane protein [Mycolicibacter arupensis]|jgi:hypothetical protein|uniref:DUF2892 domain-containing protein n=1 Tax=Mycolicibacter arupensis TaxID=342002 RepID=A0A5C7Y0E0_9MYCO|nr:DUF2892 domain-containing protein [Mycolicibacter arupensis]TXI55061.1 MAG: DUF2892 domain-containing protein [Mycolicibacter arupensis]
MQDNDSNGTYPRKRTTFGIPQPSGWPLERVLHLIAGTIVLTSLTLGQLLDGRWRILTAFVGANLLFDAMVGWCPAKLLLHRLGINTTFERALGTSPGPSEGVLIDA